MDSQQIASKDEHQAPKTEFGASLRDIRFSIASNPLAESSQSRTQAPLFSFNPPSSTQAETSNSKSERQPIISFHSPSSTQAETSQSKLPLLPIFNFDPTTSAKKEISSSKIQQPPSLSFSSLIPTQAETSQSKTQRQPIVSLSSSIPRKTEPQQSKTTSPPFTFGSMSSSEHPLQAKAEEFSSCGPIGSRWPPSTEVENAERKEELKRRLEERKAVARARIGLESKESKTENLLPLSERNLREFDDAVPPVTRRTEGVRSTIRAPETMTPIESLDDQWREINRSKLCAAALDIAQKEAGKIREAEGEGWEYVDDPKVQRQIDEMAPGMVESENMLHDQDIAREDRNGDGSWKEWIGRYGSVTRKWTS